jgi:uncharacterized membrane protein
VVSFETRTGKWLALALTASLAVNLFLGGLFVGRWLGPSPVMAERGPRGGERPVQAMMNRMAASLEADDRALFEASMERHRPRLMALGNELRESRRRSIETMGAETFDRAALEAAMSELRERNGEFQRTLHGALIEAAAGLPPPARQKIAAAGRPRSERDRPPH